MLPAICSKKVGLQAIIPDYNAEIDKEGKIINENTEIPTTGPEVDGCVTIKVI